MGETIFGGKPPKRQGGTEAWPDAQGVGIGEKISGNKEKKQALANVIEVDGLKRCSAPTIGGICGAPVKPPGKFCTACGAKLVYSDGKRDTKFFEPVGRVVIKPSEPGAKQNVSEGPSKDFVYGDTEDLAQVIDVTDYDWTPGKGYTKKKEKQ